MLGRVGEGEAGGLEPEGPQDRGMAQGAKGQNQGPGR